MSEATLGAGLPGGEDGEGLPAAERDAAYRWAAGAARGRHVLVVGSGAGHGAAVLLEAGASSVVGVEPDERSWEIATRLYGERIAFVHAEPVALPLASGSFDLVVSIAALERSLDEEAALDEIKRVLAPGGLAAISLPLGDAAISGELGGGRSPAEWERSLGTRFANVGLHRLRLALAAAVVPVAAEPTPAIAGATWTAADGCEDRGALALASDAELPELEATASLVGIRDLHAQDEALAAWELRARRAEADGAAKHWEMVAAREAQRRLRKRLHELEHRPLRILSRVLRGKPRHLGEGPPIRASERKPERWE